MENQMFDLYNFDTDKVLESTSIAQLEADGVNEQLQREGSGLRWLFASDSNESDLKNAHTLFCRALGAYLPKSNPRDEESEESVDPTVWYKLFTPDAQFTWYLLEWEPVGQDGAGRFEDVHFFCYVYNASAPECSELGYVSLNELRALRGQLGLPVERDLWFTPTPLSEVKEMHL